MGTAGLGKVLEHLRKGLAPPEVRGLRDGQLLARFVREADDACFAEVVARHGAMVLAVCRRLLRHEQDAEDAFQAVFLVLARKAASTRWGTTVGPWLHEVAVRTALDSRAAAVRRRERERQLEQAPHPRVDPAEPQDWRPVLDRELRRLPRKYREALVVCELEERPRAEAAALLGLPLGTLASRLAKAKAMLARRLARLSPAGAPGACLAGGVAPAAVPPALCQCTVRTAMLVGAGLEVAGAGPALALMKGVLKAMFLMKLKVACAVVMLGALGAGGFAFQAGRPAPAQGEAAPPRPPLDAEALRRENELLKLNLDVVLKEVRALKAEVAALKGRAGGGGTTKEEVTTITQRTREGSLAKLIDYSGTPSRAGAGSGTLAPGKGAGDVTRLDVDRETAALRDEVRRLRAAMKARQDAAKPANPLAEVEAAVKALREAGDDPELKALAADALLRATRRVKETGVDRLFQKK